MAGPYDSYILGARQRAAQGMMAPKGKSKGEKADDIGGYIGGGIGGVLGLIYGGPLGAYQGYGAGSRFGENAVRGHREFFGDGIRDMGRAAKRGDVMGVHAPTDKFGKSGATAVSSAVKGQQGMIGGLTQGAGAQGGVAGQNVQGMETAFPSTGDYWRYKTEGVKGEVNVPGYQQEYGSGNQPVSTGEIISRSGAGSKAGAGAGGFSPSDIDTLVGMF
ncbi:MAG: hypothetical protein GY911_11890 [Actinomycetales bacterium]|nr:hypothetical protein [Actinomycetales bacterium]